jgi:hypothetical protein
MRGRLGQRLIARRGSAATWTMDTLALKVILTPALIGAASLAGRRWGPAVTGLLSALPVYATTLAVFAHVLDGRPAGVAVLHGLLVGLFAFAGFFLVVAVVIERAGVLAAFAAALAVALTVQAVSLRRVGRGG